MKYRSVLGVLYDRKILIKLKGKLYKPVIRPVMLFDTESWLLRNNMFISQNENGKMGKWNEERQDSK